MKLYCPYCTKEITPETTQCPACGTKYQSETLRLLRELVKIATEDDISDRRMFDRIPKKFKIIYPTPKALKEHYLSNISQGGVFIPSKTPLEEGTRFTLKIFLPDGKEGLEISCEVMWTRKKGKVTSPGEYSSGMGVKFLNLSSEGKKRIEIICQEGKKQIDRILGRKKTFQ